MKDQNHDSSDNKFEKRSVISTLIGILIGIVIIGILWFSSSNYQDSVRVAAIGGTVSFYGVIVMTIPVFRGVYQLIVDLAIVDIDPRLLGPIQSDTERRKREIQERIYLNDRNFIGQFLIGIGTVINGFSGFV